MNRIKSLIFAAAVISAMLIMSCTAFASKSIKSVNLSVSYTDIDQENPDDNGGLNITINDTPCSVYMYEIRNAEQVRTLGEKPVVVIQLEANDGYSFSITRASQLNLKGCTYKSAKKQDSTLLIVEVTVDDVKYVIGEIEDVKLGEDYKATWGRQENAGSYEVRVFRDGRFISSSTVTGETFELLPYLTRAGEYRVSVRGVHRFDANVKSPWTESNDIVLDENQAKLNRDILEAAENAGEWIRDERGWKFKLPDGTFVTCAWKRFNKEWYYFGTDSYMQVGWLQVDGSWYYLDPEKGTMWYNRKSPEGFDIGIDGKVSR